MQFDFNVLKKNLILGIRESFSYILNENNEVYCYCLTVSSDLSSIGASAKTIVFWNDSIEEDDERMYYKFCEQDWLIYNETNEYFKCAKNQIDEFLEKNKEKLVNNNSFYYTDFFEEYRENVFNICQEALYELKKDGFFDIFLNKGGFINFMIPEYLSQDSSIEIFRKLNIGDIIQEYIDNIEEFI